MHVRQCSHDSLKPCPVGVVGLDVVLADLLLITPTPSTISPNASYGELVLRYAVGDDDIVLGRRSGARFLASVSFMVSKSPLFVGAARTTQEHIFYPN